MNFVDEIMEKVVNFINKFSKSEKKILLEILENSIHDLILGRGDH